MLERKNAFIEHCGIRFTAGNPLPVGHMEIQEYHKNPYGYVHGGALYTLADTTAGMAMYVLGKPSVTLNNDFHFLKNIKEGSIYAVSELVSEGTRINVIRVTVYADDETKLAEGNFTYYRVQG